MPEAKHTNPEERKKYDLSMLDKLFSSIGVPNVEVKIAFRIGNPSHDKTRPLKIILENKRQRRIILTNVKSIKTKATPELQRCVIVKDSTPRQREENKLKRELKKKEEGSKMYNHETVIDDTASHLVGMAQDESEVDSDDDLEDNSLQLDTSNIDKDLFSGLANNSVNRDSHVTTVLAELTPIRRSSDPERTFVGGRLLDCENFQDLTMTCD